MKAPNFKLESTSGKIIELNKIKSKYIILYFYPKDDTPGCTLETKDFNKLLTKFKSSSSVVYGISKDSVESHKKFKKNTMSNLSYCLMKKNNQLKLIKLGERKSLWVKSLCAKFEAHF